MATYYVSTTGNDSNDGSIGSPKLTLAGLYAVMSSGDTGYLRGGTYTNPDQDTYAPPSGTVGATTKLISYQNEVVTINCGTNDGLKFSNVGTRSYVDYDGRGTSGVSKNIILDGEESAPGAGVWVGNSSHHIRLYGIEIKRFPCNGTGAAITFNLSTHHCTYSVGKISLCGNDYPDNAIYVLSNDNLIEYIEITNTCGAGVQLYDDTVHVHDNIVRYNYIHDTSGSVSLARGGSGQAQGITISRGDRNKVYGNIVANLDCAESCGSGGGSWGIGFFGNGSDNEAVNNTITGLTGGMAGVQLYSGLTGVVLKNNIINQASLQIDDLGAVSPDISNNLTSGDPLFVGASDYHLQSGSPAIDGGTDLGSPYDVDYDGVARTGTWEIGAYEFEGEGAEYNPAFVTNSNVML